MSGSKKGKQYTPAARAKFSKILREKWQDPVYREKTTAMLREQAPRGSLVRDNGFRRPPRGTPEWRYYEKLCRSLGPQAARVAFAERNGERGVVPPDGGAGDGVKHAPSPRPSSIAMGISQ